MGVQNPTRVTYSSRHHGACLRSSCVRQNADGERPKTRILANAATKMLHLVALTGNAVRDFSLMWYDTPCRASTTRRVVPLWERPNRCNHIALEAYPASIPCQSQCLLPQSSRSFHRITATGTLKTATATFFDTDRVVSNWSTRGGWPKSHCCPTRNRTSLYRSSRRPG